MFAGDCRSWFRGSGKIPVIWPWYSQEQTEMFRDIRLDRLDRVACRLDAALADQKS